MVEDGPGRDRYNRLSVCEAWEIIELVMYRYNVHGLFSFTSNIPHFEGMLHAFRSEEEISGLSSFRFILDPGLKIPKVGKQRINLMLYHNPHDNSIEFDYQWFVPISAKLSFLKNPPGYVFSFNRNYLRVSQLVGGGWTLVSIFRSLLQMTLVRKRMLMLYGGAINIGDRGILFPAVENIGKTTTAWMLAKRGARYVTDEYVILDTEGRCYGIPCSSFLTPTTIKTVGLKLARGEKIALALNYLKGRILTIHLSSGGTAIDPDRFFKVCSAMKVNKLAIIQNGTDFVRRMGKDEALSKVKVIQSIEFPWKTNPYVLAHWYFNPELDMKSLSSQEDSLLDSAISRIPDLYLVSSSSREHYKAIEKLAVE